MRVRHYKAVVLGSTLFWFLLGLHWPIVHEMTSHGHAPHWSVMGAVVVIGILALVTLWTALRAPLDHG